MPNAHDALQQPLGTAPRGGEDIMHLEKPTLATHLGDPTLKGYAMHWSYCSEPQAGGPKRSRPTPTELFQETEKRHGAYEPTAPKHHWSGWYAAYVVARERGRTSDEAAKEATLHIEGALAAQA